MFTTTDVVVASAALRDAVLQMFGPSASEVASTGDAMASPPLEVLPGGDVSLDIIDCSSTPAKPVKLAAVPKPPITALKPKLGTVPNDGLRYIWLINQWGASLPISARRYTGSISKRAYVTIDCSHIMHKPCAQTR